MNNESKNILLIVLLVVTGVLSFNNFKKNKHHAGVLSQIELDAAQTLKLINEQIKKDIEQGEI